VFCSQVVGPSRNPRRSSRLRRKLPRTWSSFIRGRDQGGFVEEAQRKFDEGIKLPEGCQVTWGGMFENLERARRRLYMILPVTIALIFALLFSAFGKSSYAGLVLMSVPFSLVGGIVALWVRGINLSVSAAVGFISLFGVAC
jgi:cobalt-zinc-cadmium resistance protein CzcA